METTPQLASLSRFLTSIYGAPTRLESMIDELGFGPGQCRWLCDERLVELAEALVEALRIQLTRGELDLWFRVLNRRFGLDGQPAVPVDETARLLNVTLEQASRAEADALQRCRTKAMQQELKKELRRIALAELLKGGVRPDKQDVADKLNRLADLRAAVDLTRMDYEQRKAEVLKEVQAELDALESEYQPLLDAALDNAAALEAEIKNDVLLAGQSVSTSFYQAIYMKGRVTWDNDGINKYAQLHPEVLKYRKEGQPSVSLRTVGKSSEGKQE
jgi:hypothetical protein